MHKLKIAYVTGNRADFGLMIPVLTAISRSKKLSLRVYATGMHLMPQFGQTINEVKKKFPHTKIIQATFNANGRLGMAEFTGTFLSQLVHILSVDRPDFVLILGDRVEMLSTAIACLYLGIPTGQLHGGEKTMTVDDTARHAITKLCSLHFPATKKSAQRIVSIGEEKWRIKIVGAPALDQILFRPLPTKNEVYRYLKIHPSKKYILITQHPVSEQWDKSAFQIRETLKAVKQFKMPIVATYPNDDAGGRQIISEIEKERKNPLFTIRPSIPYKMFLAVEKNAAVWIGNSSGAMIESSSFHTPVVNIGIRQNGRERGNNVLDATNDHAQIYKAIRSSIDAKYKKKISHGKNPWGDGKTSERVVKFLENLRISPRLINKSIANE